MARDFGLSVLCVLCYATVGFVSCGIIYMSEDTCDGPSPVSEVSIRSDKSTGSGQRFGEWNLVHYYTGISTIQILPFVIKIHHSY